jgi:hypothetical protein
MAMSQRHGIVKIVLLMIRNHDSTLRYRKSAIIVTYHVETPVDYFARHRLNRLS